MEIQDNQAPDNEKLLNEMMRDLKSSAHLYQPTNYWSFYEKYFLPELKKFGLKDFRRRKNSVLSSFGATDLSLDSTWRLNPIKLPFPFPGVGRINRFINRTAMRFLRAAIPFTSDELTEYLHLTVKSQFDERGFDLSKCPSTRIGNPEDSVEIDGGPWSRAHLQCCALFADAAKRIDFKTDTIFCELGTGLGRNIEILSRLFEKATFLMFDIPPQLYVAHQYISTAFGSRVVPYGEAVRIRANGDGTLPSELKGKIIILPSWKMPDLADLKIDVFWNSASFQEMEPDVVQNYLNLALRMRAEWIYINAMPGGNYWGEWKAGRGGTKQPVLERHYLDALSRRYNLTEKYFSNYFLRKPSYMSYIFKRNSEIGDGS